MGTAAGTFSDAYLVSGLTVGYSFAAVTASQYLLETVMPFRGRLGGVQAHADLAGSGAGSTVLDVLLNGASIWTSAANRPTLPAASTGAFTLGAAPSARVFRAGDRLALLVASISTTGHGRLKLAAALERGQHETA